MPTSSTTRRGNGSGKGQGWGGAAKGAGSKAPSFTESLENRIDGAEAADPAVREWAAIKAMSREQQAELVKDEMLRISLKGEREGDRVVAGKAILDRIEGTPVTRNLNLNGDLSHLSDDELAQRRAWLEGELNSGRDAGGGRTPPTLPQ